MRLGTRCDFLLRFDVPVCGTINLKGQRTMKIYSLLDLKVKEYGQLVLMANDESVKRALRDMAASGGQSTLQKYPEDFNLMCLGEFDPETGRLVAFEVPSLVDNVKTITGGK